MTIGSDPEFFLLDTTNKKILNAENIIEGDKLLPFIHESGINWLVDGVTAEINPLVANCKNSFIDKTLQAKELLTIHLPPNVKLLEITSTMLNQDQLTENSKIVGCEPDFNIYLKKDNCKPVIEDIFFAGGHIHFGLDTFNNNDIFKIVKLLDKELLKYVNSLEKTYTNEFELGVRKQVQYGKKGNIRFKSYGFEYRSISNKWAINDETIANTYDIIESVLNYHYHKSKIYNQLKLKH